MRGSPIHFIDEEVAAQSGHTLHDVAHGLPFHQGWCQTDQVRGGLTESAPLYDVAEQLIELIQELESPLRRLREGLGELTQRHVRQRSR